jgi:arsenate reductase-like glutaredoxin family protein
MKTTNEIKATANKSARTFTLRTSYAKYRTTKMSKEEFNSCLYNTNNDWEEFLKSSDYSVVK